jgi:hypothetical protein
MRAGWLLTLYPRAWRDRYAEEFLALLESQPASIGVVVDVIAGAMDAHLSPQWEAGLQGAETSKQGGTVMRLLAIRCAGATHFSRAEQLWSACLTIGATLGIILLYISIKRVTGENLFVEALGIAAFPIAVFVGSTQLYLRDHSSAARIAFNAIVPILMYLGSLLAAWL